VIIETMQLRHVISLISKWSVAFAVGAMLTPAAMANSVNEAKALAENGNIADAISMLQKVVTANPKSTEAPMLLGDYYLATGQNALARSAYSDARKKGSRDAILALAELATTEYLVDEARSLVSAYRKAGTKGKKDDDESADVSTRIDRVESFLQRVEQIEIIDSLVVDADTFFRSYRLSPESGSVNDTDILPTNFNAADPTVVYKSNSGQQMIWAAPDDEGTFHLMCSTPLYGDEWDTPTAIGDHLGEGGDANYPFLMPDGVTLYFANDGENSIGGLDIFVARYGDNGYLQPQNIGMPYNSPYNDYMLAIDELNGVGWWATDRNCIPGKVTIYLFIPSEVRKNIDPNSPNVVSRARITSIKDTWTDSDKRTEALQRISEITTNNGNSTANSNQFQFFIPGRGVYTEYSDFRNAAARQAMQNYLIAQRQYAQSQEHLESLREEYSHGKKNLASKITNAEKQLAVDKAKLKRLRNAVINAEK
jgi:tetratricopeptide (TPR) repeat protein